ncbi:MAG: CpXC domain-containing protein [Chloroflexi bacterium]|nr:CpXC domain-containing protein [Chloroflexota bacterium]
MPFPALPTRVTCPNCHKPFMVELRTIIDVGQEPELKAEFLHQNINVARCPECGAGGMLSSPLLYHDPAKELLITYVPAELGMKADEQEKFVGGLVKAVMDSLPAEKRKAYFFQPKTALTMDGLFDAILEADGVSPEALAAQRARMRTLNALVSVLDDDKSFAEVVEQHRSELDYEFLLDIAGLIDASEQEGNQEAVTMLQKLREKILALVDVAEPQQAPANASADELIDLLLTASQAENWRTTVNMNRVRLDYSFFQALTAKIEAAQQDGDTVKAEELTALRDKILDELDSQETMLRSVEDQAVLFIMDLMEAPDLGAALRENRQGINEIVLSTAARLRAVAQSSGREARAKQLQTIVEKSLDILENDLPPEAKLINQLMRADYPEATNRILEEHRAMLTDGFVALVDKYIESLNGSDRGKLAEHLQQVRDQITAKRLILRS